MTGHAGSGCCSYAMQHMARRNCNFSDAVMFSDAE